MVLNRLQDTVEYLQSFLGLNIKSLWDVSCYYLRVVVEIFLLCLEVYVRIMDNMVLFHELLRVVNQDLTLACNWTFFYVNWNLQEEMSLLNVFVKEQQTTCIYFQVCVRYLKLLVGKHTEFVFDKLHSFFNSLKIFCKSLTYFTLFQKLQTLSKGLWSHFTQYKIIGLPWMEVEILIDFFFDLDFIRNNKIFRGYFVVIR